MWDDGFWFLVSALITTAICLYYTWSRPASARPAVRPMRGRQHRRPAPPGVRRILGGCVLFVSVIFIVRAYLYWNVDHAWSSPSTWSSPSIGTTLAVGIGVLFGLFTGVTTAHLLQAKQPVRFLWPAALALLVLSVGYSLPVYHDQIADLLQNLGLSHLKLSVADVELETDVTPKSSGSVSATGGPTSNAAQTVTRPNDSEAGLRTLAGDFAPPASVRGRPKISDIIHYDYEYIKQLNDLPESDLKGVYDWSQGQKNLLEPISFLASCLMGGGALAGADKDSQLLLIDTKSVLTALFQLHQKSIQNMKNFTSSAELGVQAGPFVDISENSSRLSAAVEDAVGQTRGALGAQSAEPVNGLFHLVRDTMPRSDASTLPAEQPEESCHHSDHTIVQPAHPDFTVTFAPYVTLALADLLIADGAPDQAVTVLAEWLSQWNVVDKLIQQRQQAGVPSTAWARAMEWYGVRVMSRLVVNLEKISGRNNRSYRFTLGRYQQMLADYTRDKLSLDQLNSAKCDELSKSEKQLSEGSPDTLRRVAFLLIGTEMDVLLTETGFTSEEGNFEKLDELHERAERLHGLKSNCLPDGPMFEGEIPAGNVVAGAISLAAGEQMDAIAHSAGDRKRARQAREDGEEWLRDGWRDLRPIWTQNLKTLEKQDDWVQRIFTAPKWDEYADLAMRVLSQLHHGDDLAYDP
jgi:hypothetical protein